MRVLCPCRVPGLCRGRLQGKRDVRAGQGPEHGQAPAPLARGQPAADLEMLLLQEDMLVVRVLDRISMRMVRDHVSRRLPEPIACRVQVWHPRADLLAAARSFDTPHRSTHGGNYRRAGETEEHSVAARPFLS